MPSCFVYAAAAYYFHLFFVYCFRPIFSRLTRCKNVVEKKLIKLNAKVIVKRLKNLHSGAALTHKHNNFVQ